MLNITYILIRQVSVEFVLNEELQLTVEFEHKLGTGGDGIAIKQVGSILALTQKLVSQHH